MNRSAGALLAIALALSAPSPGAAALPQQPADSPPPAAAELDALARSGLDLAVLYGIPLSDEVARVREVAERARAAAVGDDPAAASLRARAHVLLAATVADPATQRRHVEAAFASLAPAIESASLPPLGRAALAAAMLLRAGPGDAADAAMHYTTLLEPGATRLPPALTAELHLGRLHADAAVANTTDEFNAALARFERARAAAPFVAGGAPDPLLTVIATDATCRVLLARWRAGHDQALLERAVNEQLALLRRADLGLDEPARRALVYGKLAAMLDDAMPLIELPPEAMLAEAVVLARDENARRRALDMLAALADRPDAGPLAAEAIWESAVILTRSEAPADRLRAVGGLLRLAREHRSHPRAAPALEAALAYARALVADPGELPPDQVRAAYLDALTLATGPSANPDLARRWLAERARLILDGRKLTPADPEALAALDMLDRAARTPESDALWAGTLATLIDDAHQRRAEALRAGDAATATKILTDELLPLTNRAQAGGDRARAAADRFAADHADALTDAGRAAGRAIYRRLLDAGAQVPGGPARLRLGLARAMILDGDNAAAFTLLRDIAAPLEGPAPRPEPYWHAWTLMLELLAAENADGARDGAIRAHLKRLELLDPALGGEPWRSRLAAVRDGLAR